MRVTSNNVTTVHTNCHFNVLLCVFGIALTANTSDVNRNVKTRSFTSSRY